MHLPLFFYCGELRFSILITNFKISLWWLSFYGAPFYFLGVRVVIITETFSVWLSHLWVCSHGYHCTRSFFMLSHQQGQCSWISTWYLATAWTTDILPILLTILFEWSLSYFLDFIFCEGSHRCCMFLITIAMS